MQSRRFDDRIDRSELRCAVFLRPQEIKLSSLFHNQGHADDDVLVAANGRHRSDDGMPCAGPVHEVCILCQSAKRGFGANARKQVGILAGAKQGADLIKAASLRVRQPPAGQGLRG
jgi:hypothetical protein